MRMRLLVGISLLLASYPPVGLAEQIRVGPVYTDRVGEVSVVVELPPGVTPEAADFRLRVDDTIITPAEDIKAFQQAGRGLAFVICVDVSGSMTRGPLDDTKEALLTFLGRARSEDRIALISFADEDELLSSFEQTREHLTAAIRNLHIRGSKTRLYQTVYRSLDLFQGAAIPQRRRVVVISDGKDEGSTEGPLSVGAKSKALGIPIDTVGRGRIEQQYSEALRVLSDSTGGRFVHARPDRLALTDALERLYQDVLETRSLVVYFRYEAEQAGRTIQNAVIELQRPGQTSLRGGLPGGIPQMRVQPQPSVTPVAEPAKGFQVSTWVWLLVGALVGVGLVIWGGRRAKSQGKAVNVPHEPAIAESESLSHTAVRHPLPHETQVGSSPFLLPAPGQPTAILKGTSGPVIGWQVSVEKALFRIGANPENDLSIGNDDYVSGEHAYLRYDNGNLLIFDNSSRNGTFVNQREVIGAGFALSVGDHIQVGRSTFEVERA